MTSPAETRPAGGLRGEGDGNYHGVPDRREKPVPSIEGMVGNIENKHFDAVEEVITVGKRPEQFLVKGRFAKRHARMIKRLNMEEQIRENGRLNYNSCYRLDTLLSIAIDAYARNQYAEVLSGMVRISNAARTGMSNFVEGIAGKVGGMKR